MWRHMESEYFRYLQGKTIVLVEDYDENREQARIDLERFGITVFSYPTHKALERDLHNLPHIDLLVFDNNINMPKYAHEKSKTTDWLPGFRRAPNNPLSETPVVLWTDTQLPPTRILEALDLGIKGFIHKTFTGSFSIPAAVDVLYRVLRHQEICGGNSGIIHVSDLLKKEIIAWFELKFPADFSQERRQQVLDMSVEDRDRLLSCAKAPEDLMYYKLRPQNRPSLRLNDRFAGWGNEGLDTFRE